MKRLPLASGIAVANGERLHFASLNPQPKLLKQVEKLALFKAGEDFAPSLVEVSPTNYCNASCDWCFYVPERIKSMGHYKQKHTKEQIDPEVLEKLFLDDIVAMGVPAINWTGGGEPTIYKGFDRVTAYAARLGLKQGLFTNGYREIPHPEFFEWIRVTVTERFTVPESAQVYAGETKVGVNFNLCPENESRVLEMAIQARNMGLAYFQVRPALADRWDLQKEVRMPEELKNLETDDFKIVLTGYKFDDYQRPHGYPNCYGHRFVPMVWHNGDVDVCAYHFGKEPYNFGNLFTDGGFKAIWEGSRRQAMKDDVAVVDDCQHCCKNHEINKVLAVLKGDVKVDDEEFL